MQTVLLKTCLSCGLLSTGGNYYSLMLRNFWHHASWRELPATSHALLDSVHDIFADVILDDLRVWPLYDLMCFGVVPPHLRPTTTALVSVCWHTYMSFVASRCGGAVCAH